MRFGAHNVMREFTALCQPCPAKGEAPTAGERSGLPGFSRGAEALLRIGRLPAWQGVGGETRQRPGIFCFAALVSRYGYDSGFPRKP